MTPNNYAALCTTGLTLGLGLLGGVCILIAIAGITELTGVLINAYLN